jgi:hypothetical protein
VVGAGLWVDLCRLGSHRLVQLHVALHLAESAFDALRNRLLIPLLLLLLLVAPPRLRLLLLGLRLRCKSCEIVKLGFGTAK